MQTIKHIKLVLRRGRERLYIAEIVELTRDGPAQYVVNYRYGWSGTSLSEGTRTADPVDLETAQRLFDSLVLSRRNQGYVENTDETPWQSPEATGPSPVPMT